MTFLRTTAVLGLTLIGTAVFAHAAVAPEIDPSSGMSAIALLSGALLIIRGRKK